MTNLNWSDVELNGIKARILQRVYVSWFVRKIMVPTISVLAISGGVLFYAVKAQHVAMIFRNISKLLSNMDVIGLSKYLLVAVQKTELDLLALTVSATLLALYFSRKLIRETLSFWMKRELISIK